MRGSARVSGLLAAFAILFGACATSSAPAGAPPAGAAATKATPGGTLTFVLEDNVINFDPMLSRAFVDRNAHYQIYDSLVAIDENGKIIPWLAEKWDTSADGKTVTFSLRKDVKYHDGTAFDAESVKWNLDRYRLTKGSARAGELAPIDSVTVVDPSTVRVALKQPFAPFLATLIDRAGMMLSRKAVEAGGAGFTSKPIGAGSGPFKFVESLKDDHTTLERNPSWWGKDKDGSKLPYLDKIVIKHIVNTDVRFTNMRTGDAQVQNNISGKDVPTAKADPSFNYQEKPAYEFRSLIPNRAKGFVFEDARYVKALSMAIDRAEILAKVYFGLGSVGYGTIAPPHFAFDPSFKPFEKADPEGAKKLIAAVGKPLSAELLITANSPVDLTLAQLIQAQVKKADIDIQIATLEFAKILDLQSAHTFKGLALTGWSGRVDPDGNTYDFVYSGRPLNDSSYSNKEVDRLLDESRQTSDQAKRKAAFRAAEQIYVVDDPARIWLGFGPAQLLTAKRVQGLVPYPDKIVRFEYAWLQK